MLHVTFPARYPGTCVECGTRVHVGDPMVAASHGHRYVGIDASRDYLDLSLRTRLAQGALLGEDAS